MARPRKEIVATDFVIGQDKEVTLPASGSVQEAADEIREIEPVSGYGLTEKAAALAFMEEKIEVIVHDSHDQNAEPVVHVSVNGVNQFFPRNRPVVVKRKFVEVLARAKHTSIATPETRDMDGNRTTKVTRHSALKYPFSVLRDENPNGRAWLQKTLAEAA